MKNKSQVLRNISSEKFMDDYVNFTEMIIHDEFYGYGEKDYRNRAIDRLISMNVNWHSEPNIEYDIMKRFVKIICPYCGRIMSFNGVTGRMYACDLCNVSASASVDISFKIEH